MLILAHNETCVPNGQGRLAHRGVEMDGVLWGLQTALVAGVTAGAFWCARGLFGMEVSVRWKRGVLAAGCVVLTAATLWQRSQAMYSRGYLLVCILVCCLMGRFCFDGSADKIAAVFSVYFETFCCLEIGLCGAAAALWPQMNPNQLFQRGLGWERILLEFTAGALLAALAAVLFCRREKLGTAFLFFGRTWMLIPLLEHVFLILCDRVLAEGQREEGIRYGAWVLILSPFLALIFVLLGLYRKYAVMYRQMETQNELYLSKYEKDFRDLMERERIYHDMKNHLIVLKKYMDEGNMAKAEEYVAKLMAVVDSSDSEEKIGHPVLDYLVHEKRRAAQRKGIQVTEEVENLQSVFEGLDAGELADWCAILGNLWDNAIEGCVRAQTAGRITFSVKRAGNVAAVRISNTSRRSVDVKDLSTEKPEKKRHGIGMRSIRYAVDKYYGSMECSCRNGIFEVSVVMFL